MFVRAIALPGPALRRSAHEMKTRRRAGSPPSDDGKIVTTFSLILTAV
jgi:hypothetical protein